MLWKSAYTLSLEERILELKEEIKEHKAQNNKLIEALVPILRKRVEHEAPLTAGDILEGKKKHEVHRTPTGAACSCGELFTGDDSGKLQEAISAHVLVVQKKAIQTGRRSWPEMRKKLEVQAEMEETT